MTLLDQFRINNCACSARLIRNTYMHCAGITIQQTRQPRAVLSTSTLGKETPPGICWNAYGAGARYFRAGINARME